MMVRRYRSSAGSRYMYPAWVSVSRMRYVVVRGNLICCAISETVAPLRWLSVVNASRPRTRALMGRVDSMDQSCSGYMKSDELRSLETVRTATQRLGGEYICFRIRAGHS